MKAWFDARFDVVMSVEQLGEIARTLGDPKIRRRLARDEQRIEQFIRQLYIRAEVIESHASVEVPRDPKDAPILATLISSGADVLVSGDRDLLELRVELSDPDAGRVRPPAVTIRCVILRPAAPPTRSARGDARLRRA